MRDDEEKKILKLFNDYKVEYDKLDYKAEYDDKISFEENKRHLLEMIRHLSQEKKTSKAEQQSLKDKQNYNEIQTIILQEKQAEQEFLNTLKALKESDSGEILKQYEIPKEYIKSVIKGFNRSFIFLGDAGLGKTYLTRQTLMKENTKFLESRGVASPLALYQFIYENNSEDMILVFDDVAGLINNPNSYSILLNVLYEGFVSWNSTTEKLKIPKKFKFNGKIIIIANKLDGYNADVVKSRCLVYDLRLTKEEKIKMMYSIAKQKHSSLTEEERNKIVDFINENSVNCNFDLRTQQKIEHLFQYDKNRWKELSVPLLQKNEDMEFVMMCIKSSNSIQEAEQKFIRESGKSRTTFYNLKKEILN